MMVDRNHCATSYRPEPLQCCSHPWMLRGLCSRACKSASMAVPSDAWERALPEVVADGISSHAFIRITSTAQPFKTMMRRPTMVVRDPFNHIP